MTKQAATKTTSKATDTVQQASSPTITVDGKAFAIADLTPQLQNAIALLNNWNADKTEAEQKVIQLQYAVNALSVEIAKAINPPAEAPAAE